MALRRQFYLWNFRIVDFKIVRRVRGIWECVPSTCTLPTVSVNLVIPNWERESQACNPLSREGWFSKKVSQDLSRVPGTRFLTLWPHIQIFRHKTRSGIVVEAQFQDGLGVLRTNHCKSEGCPNRLQCRSQCSRKIGDSWEVGRLWGRYISPWASPSPHSVHISSGNLSSQCLLFWLLSDGILL